MIFSRRFKVFAASVLTALFALQSQLLLAERIKDIATIQFMLGTTRMNKAEVEQAVTGQKDPEITVRLRGRSGEIKGVLERIESRATRASDERKVRMGNVLNPVSTRERRGSGARFRLCR